MCIYIDFFPHCLLCCFVFQKFMSWAHFSLSEKLHLSRAQAVSDHVYVDDFQLLTTSADLAFKLQISIFICPLTISVILQIPKMVCHPNIYLFFLFFFFAQVFFFWIFKSVNSIRNYLSFYLGSKSCRSLVPQFMFGWLSNLSFLLLGFCFLVPPSFPYFTCFSPHIFPHFLPIFHLLPQTFNMLCLFLKYLTYCILIYLFM